MGPEIAVESVDHPLSSFDLTKIHRRQLNIDRFQVLVQVIHIARTPGLEQSKVCATPFGDGNMPARSGADAKAVQMFRQINANEPKHPPPDSDDSKLRKLIGAIQIHILPAAIA